MTSMRLLRTLAPIAIVFVALLSACRNDPVGVDTQPKICFAKQVLPIFQNNCGKSGCHASEGRAARGLDLSTADGVLRNVTPFKPFSSSIYTAMTNTWQGIMPPKPNPPISLEQRTIVYLWILQGADTSCVGQ